MNPVYAIKDHFPGGWFDGPQVWPAVASNHSHLPGSTSLLWLQTFAIFYSQREQRKLQILINFEVSKFRMLDTKQAYFMVSRAGVKSGRIYDVVCSLYHNTVINMDKNRTLWYC